MRRDRPGVYDVSSLDDSDIDLQAATLLACWSAGFGTINVSNALADAGLEPRRHYFVVLDELWRAARRARHGRPGRRPHPPEPAAQRRGRDDLPHHVRPARPRA